MVLLKRKPVILTPLPTLSTILQPLSGSSSSAVSHHPEQESSPAIPPPKKGKKGGTANIKEEIPPPAGSTSTPEPGEILIPIPEPKDDEEQLDRLLALLRGEYAPAPGIGKGKGRGVGHKSLGAITSKELEVLAKSSSSSSSSNHGNGVINGNGHGGPEEMNGSGSGDVNGGEGPAWRIWDRECFYIPETGEVFTDYESYCQRRHFYDQPLFQCEVSGRSGLSYFAALASEQREVRQLHTRFPSQLKQAVLSAVQFQIEGKLENLADKIYERFVNRFFNEEKVFVDVGGDKYLARIVHTFPPKSLTGKSPAKLKLPINISSSSSAGSSKSITQVLHPFASDLSLDMERLLEKDDPMKYFYNVRLIEEGVEEGLVQEYKSNGGGPGDDGDENGSGVKGDDEEEGDPKWGGSTMEVQADKISRDRINFSRAMLKRFIRDCVHRDPAVYSPWLVKPSVAARYGIPTEMTPEIRAGIQTYRERQMDKRKREREERLGITAQPPPEEDIKQPSKKKKKTAKGEEEVKVEEIVIVEEKKKRKPLKYPAEDLLVEWSEEKDGPAGRIEFRPPPNRHLPFSEHFETFLMAWSFLNVMGKPLHLSPFTLDDFEQSLYHREVQAGPAPLLVEIHSCLINCLIGDLKSGAEPVRPLKSSGMNSSDDEGGLNDTDYWAGRKGATTETIGPIAKDFAGNWKLRDLSPKDSRKGWENALIGCLWERATLDSLPSYLDNILDLTFEDKPIPTRPTWSTGPSVGVGGTAIPQGLIPAKPEKRYSSLHHLDKLAIIAFLVDLVSQTVAVRDFLEESSAALTEVRKEQVDVKRDWRKAQADKEALEPKKPVEEAEGAENGQVEGEHVPIPPPNGKEQEPEPERKPSVSPSINGMITKTNSSNAEMDELDDSVDNASEAIAEDDPMGADSDEEGDHRSSRSLSSAPSENPGAQRRKAMALNAAQRKEEEQARKTQVAKERELQKIQNKEQRQLAAEKKKLDDIQDIATARLRELEFEFRANYYALRARPLGIDRYGNKIWWMDGLGSSPILVNNGRDIIWGTGRLFVQGVEDSELEWNRLAVLGVWDDYELSLGDVRDRKVKEEGEGKLSPGEWGSYDTVEQLTAFINYLNPRGIRESHLLKVLKQWRPELETGMKKRRLALGLEASSEDDAGGRRTRMTRKAAGEDGEGYMAWKNKRAV